MKLFANVKSPFFDTHNVVEAGWLLDTVTEKPVADRDILGNLIKPYASFDELVYDVRHVAGGSIAFAGSLATTIALSLTAAVAVGTQVASDYVEDTETKATLSDISEKLLDAVIQMLVDIVTLPLNLAVLICRAVATAVKYIQDNSEAILAAISYPFEVIADAFTACFKEVEACFEKTCSDDNMSCVM